MFQIYIRKLLKNWHLNYIKFAYESGLGMPLTLTQNYPNIWPEYVSDLHQENCSECTLALQLIRFFHLKLLQILFWMLQILLWRCNPKSALKMQPICFETVANSALKCCRFSSEAASKFALKGFKISSENASRYTLICFRISLWNASDFFSSDLLQKFALKCFRFFIWTCLKICSETVSKFALNCFISFIWKCLKISSDFRIFALNTPQNASDGCKITSENASRYDLIGSESAPE